MARANAILTAVAHPGDGTSPVARYYSDMLELVFYIWLLGAALIFVGVAMTGDASDRFEALWLLALAASWPFLLLFMAFGAVLVAISAAAGIKR